MPLRQMPAPQRRVVLLIAWLSVVALLTTASSWAALALALRSLESVWHDRVEALAFLHGTMLPLERAVPHVIAAAHASDTVGDVAGDTIAARLRVAREGAARAWSSYLATTLTADEARVMREVTPAVERALTVTDSLARAISAARGARQGISQETLGTIVLPSFEASTAGLERLVAIQRTETRQQVEAARARYGLARTTLAASAVATLLMLTAILTTTRGARTPWRRR